MTPSLSRSFPRKRPPRIGRGQRSASRASSGLALGAAGAVFRPDLAVCPAPAAGALRRRAARLGAHTIAIETLQKRSGRDWESDLPKGPYNTACERKFRKNRDVPIGTGSTPKTRKIAATAKRTRRARCKKKSKTASAAPSRAIRPRAVSR